jgi:flavin-dependent dehydrogenase
VLDRAGLDRWLLNRAVEAGVEVRCPAAAVGLAGRVLRTTEGSVEFGVLIAADGATSAVRRWAGLPPPAELLVGVQAIVADATGARDGVEVYVGRSVAPGGFAWVVPAEEGVARVGLLTPARRDGTARLSRFLAERYPANRVLRQESGLVPIGPPPRTTGERILLVGDAAGQVKPLSGGGLLFGLVAARIGGEIAALQPDRIGDYETRWRAELENEIAFGLRGRNAFLSLTDGDLDRIVVALDRPEIQRLVAEEGDLDRPSGLAQAVLARPSAWPAMLPLVRAVGGWNRARELALGLPSAAEPG